MKTIKRLLWLFLFVSVMVNAVAIMHAYRFTHFADAEIDKTNDAKKLTTVEKLKTLISGVKNPRPENVNIPRYTFETISLKSKKKIEGWLIPAKSSKGTIILLHGFSGD